MLDKAERARTWSYSPYAHFAVGAALECADGSVCCGANIENASFPLGMCAERNAIYHALMRGKKKEDFVSLAIVADTDEPCSPCGACRQVLWELFPLDAPIYLGNLKNEIKHVTAKELLPFAFNGEDL